MIVIPDKQIVIITPPHTASGNIHRSLCSPEFGGLWVNSPNPEGIPDQHGHGLSAAWYGFRQVLVVRNPLDRLVGLFLHHEWASEHNPHLLTRPGLTWVEFVEAVVTDDTTKLNWMFRWTITRLIEFAYRIDRVVRFESLQADLASHLGSTINIAPPYHDANPLADWFADPHIAEVANHWAYPDFRRFYPSESSMSLT